METSKLECLGSAAAGIAHDINNQLTLILNHLADTNIEGARRAVDRCASLTAGLISYCRGESIKLRKTNPADLLRDFASTLRLPPGIRVHLRIAATVPIMADPFALTRVLTNLVLNASDAMQGSGVIRVGAQGSTLFVEDDGPGIPADVSRRIFEPFFTTKGARGSGLGLAIVREIMAQHSASVALRSEPAKGARFELRFRPIH